MNRDRTWTDTPRDTYRDLVLGTEDYGQKIP